MDKYDVDRDFENFSGENSLESAQTNRDNLVRLGLVITDENLANDDSIFNEPFIYCGMHHRVHSTGWCTVNVAYKRPLRGNDIDSAIDYAFDLGLIPAKH